MKHTEKGKSMISYSRPVLTEDAFTDGSVAHGVYVSGDDGHDIQFHCIDKDVANTLKTILDVAVVDIEITH